MYRYDELDRKIVAERVAQFRDQTRRYLAGEITDDEFRALRLRNGLYLQRYAPMLRVSIPYGLLSTRQLRRLAHIARRYDKGYGHFTTRQNIQYNWPKLEDVPDILAELAGVEMHAIQTSGHCVRNITTDPLAGVARDEIVDPRPYCEIARQWAAFHPEFSFLPRKFKIAFSGASQDRAATRTHDIGVHLVRNAAGAIGYAIHAGGGLGRTPILSQKIRDFLPQTELLSYLEAILRVYNRLGRRDNIHKARLKILVKDVGAPAFTGMVEAEWAQIKDTYLKLLPEDLERMKAHFPPHSHDPVAVDDRSFARTLEIDRSFATWVRRNTQEHRVPGYRIVWVSLKAPGSAPGDCTARQMDALAELADRYSFGEIRVTHDQNLVLAEVQQADAYAVWQALQGINLATPNIGTLTDLICCPGLDFCSLANAGTIGVAQEIWNRFEDLDYQYDLGEIQIKISGCMNGCGHHSVGHIGVLGVDKEGAEWYQIMLGGSATRDAVLGEKIGPAIARANVVEAIERLIEVYLERRGSEDETFLQTCRRVGVAPFKERVYAQAVAA